MYKIHNENPALDFEIDPAQVDWDAVEWRKGHFHIIYKNKSFAATLLEADYTQKSFRIDVNGRAYTLQLKDSFDQLAEKMGLGTSQARRHNQLKAPMPGLVLSILVQEGQTIKKGESLLILEAMKMENVLKASSDAVIRKINAQKGQAVDKGHILIDFE